MNHSNIPLGRPAAQGLTGSGCTEDQSTTKVEQKPELVRAFGEYAALIERLTFNLNHLEDRLSMYCSPDVEKGSACPCMPPYSSGAASHMANMNDSLNGLIRRLEALLSTLEI